MIDKDSHSDCPTESSLDKSLMLDKMKQIASQVSRKEQFFSKSRNATPERGSKTQRMCFNSSQELSMTVGSVKVDPNETLKRMEEKNKLASEKI